jgi:hypothetical protein
MPTTASFFVYIIWASTAAVLFAVTAYKNGKERDDYRNKYFAAKEQLYRAGVKPLPTEEVWSPQQLTGQVAAPNAQPLETTKPEDVPAPKPRERIYGTQDGQRFEQQYTDPSAPGYVWPNDVPYDTTTPEEQTAAQEVEDIIHGHGKWAKPPTLPTGRGCSRDYENEPDGWRADNE